MIPIPGWVMLVHYPRPRTEIVWHDGQSGGFAAMMAFDRQRQTAVVILSDTAWPVIGLPSSSYWLPP